MSKYALGLLPLIISLFLSGCFNSESEQKQFYGNVDLRTVSLGFRVSGKISELFFDEGEKVKENEPLAKLDDALYIQALNQIQAQVKMQEAQVSKLKNGYRVEDIQKAQANFDKAEVELKKANKDLNRYKQLLKTASISKQTFDDHKLVFDSAQAQYDYAKHNLQLLKNGYLKEDILSAQAQLEALKAQLEEAKIHLEDTTLLAPSSGTILTRAYEKGAIVAQGAPVFEMALDQEYWIRSYIDEPYLGKIQPNMRATVYTDTQPNKTYEAIVSFISAQAEFTPKSVQTQELRTQLVYRIRLILQNPDEYIRQGMPVTIEFEEL